MKRIFVLLFIIFILSGCSKDTNTEPKDNFDHTDSRQILELRRLYFGNMSPFRFAVIKGIVLDSTVALKDHYRYEYKGGTIDNTVIDNIADEIGQLTECIDNENVKEDIYRVYALLRYADEHNSHQAFDTAYEILETLNAYLFNYPLTQDIFSDWELQVNAGDINKFYPVAISFGCNYSTDEIVDACKDIEVPYNTELENRIENNEKKIEKQIKELKENNNDIYGYMRSVSIAARNFKYAAENYNPDTDYCENVRRAAAELDNKNDRLLAYMRDCEVKQEYIEISKAVSAFYESCNNSFTQLDILADVNEIYYNTVKLEYLYCNSDNNIWLNENIYIRIGE